MVVTELSEMKAVHAVIRQLVPTGLCHPSPVVSRPQELVGVSDEPEAPAFIAARSLDVLPPPQSFSMEKAGRRMDAALWDAERQGGAPALRGLDATVVGPGAWLQSGKRFMSPLPQVEGYCSDYYRTMPQGADVAVLRRPSLGGTAARTPPLILQLSRSVVRAEKEFFRWERPG
jgi:hypothetical protein